MNFNISLKYVTLNITFDVKIDYNSNKLIEKTSPNINNHRQLKQEKE